jgi:hypothetical protein
MTQYIVLRKQDDGFHDIGNRHARSADQATRAAATDLYRDTDEADEAGAVFHLVAIPARSFEVVQVTVEPEPKVTIRRKKG